MKSVKFFVFALLFASQFVFGQATWKIDATHSNLMFKVQHLVISEVGGYFREFDGSLVSKNDKDFSGSTINLVAKVASINTDNADRDKHLKSDDFFSADKYPELKFVSKSFKKVSGNKYVLVGDLTIRDVTKQVKLDVEYKGTVKDPWGNTKSGFKLTGAINRFDYNLKWNSLIESGGAVVGKTVKLEANVELAKQK
jgi:polyisoprenoid-binding protein YceI